MFLLLNFDVDHIYILWVWFYRGDKAFCSTECRSTQIMNDERKEQCRAEASRRSGDVSSSSYSRDEIFFSAGILAI